jgi:hypothetical protein
MIIVLIKFLQSSPIGRRLGRGEEGIPDSNVEKGSDVGVLVQLLHAAIHRLLQCLDSINEAFVKVGDGFFRSKGLAEVFLENHEPLNDSRVSRVLLTYKR